MTPDVLCYIAQFAAATLYAIFLELCVTRRRYEGDHTWATVVGGVAMVGLIVAARLAWAPLPALEREALAWWVWWVWFWSFAWSGIPIIVWQLVVQRKKIADLIAYVRKER